MYTLYKDRWILDENGVAIAQRCRGTTNEQWKQFLFNFYRYGTLQLNADQHSKYIY